MSFSNHSHKSKQIFFYQSPISILLNTGILYIYFFFLQIILKIGILISKVVELEKQYRSSVFDIPVYFFMDYCNPLRKKTFPKIPVLRILNSIFIVAIYKQNFRF